MAKKKAPRIEPAHSLLYDPSALLSPQLSVLPEDLLKSVSLALKNPFNEKQRQAFARSFSERVSLIWGPPGTGKSTVLEGIVLGWLLRASQMGQPISIGIGASNYNAIDNVLIGFADLLDQYHQKPNALAILPEIIRVRSSHAQEVQDKRLKDVVRDSQDGGILAEQLLSPEKSFVIGGTWQQLSKLSRPLTDSRIPTAKWFDLFIIDEASQMEVSGGGGYFLLMKDDGHLVLAGDHKQLGPIYGFDIQDNGNGLLDCIFSYMRQTHKLEPVKLDKNYRNNYEIAEWPKKRFYEGELEAVASTRRLDISFAEWDQEKPAWWANGLPWTAEYLRILDPALPVVVITYAGSSYTLSNPFEAQTIAALSAIYRRGLESKFGKLDNNFWEEQFGIVTPHRAQIASIRNKLVESGHFHLDPMMAVDTVDRFQGLERDLIAASYTVADPDFIGSEEEFILDPRRFNVTLTRSRSKFIMLVSDSLLQYLPSDPEVARSASDLQLFAAEYCSEMRKVELPFIENGVEKFIPCHIRVPSR